MLLAVAFGVLVAAAALAASALRLTSPLTFLLAVYVFSWTGLVALTELLSLGHGVGTLGYGIGEVVLLVAAAAWWQLVGRPRPPFSVRASGPILSGHPLVLGLAVVVCAVVAYALIVGVSTTPNNPDGMIYHLSRAAAWLQQGGLQYIPGAHTERENELPQNGEIGILYTFSFLKRDTAATLPQLAAFIALIVGVAAAARRLGYAPAAALFAGLLTGSLSEVVLQATTPKNDLVQASFIVASACLLTSRAPAEVALGGLAVGLAVGTKSTAFFALPFIALLLLVAVPRALVVRAALAALVGIMLVGSYAYVQNAVETGSPLGRHREQNQYRADVTARGVVSEFERIGYKFVDCPGCRVKTRWLDSVARAARRTFDALGIVPDAPESTRYPFTYTINVVADVDHCFFGPLGILLVLPMAGAFALGWLGRLTSAMKGVHALALPLFVLGLALVFRFTDEGRYLIAPVALTMPLAGSIYGRRLLAPAVAFVACLSLFFAVAYDVNKPTGLNGTTPAWRLGRAEALGLRLPGLASAVEVLDAQILPDAHIGAVLAPYDPDYPLYGPTLERRVVGLPRRGFVAEARRRGLKWIWVGHNAGRPTTPRGWNAMHFRAAGTLLRRA